MANAMLLRRDDYEAGTTGDEYGGQIPSAAREVYEMMCITEGTAEYWVEAQHYRLRAGDIMLIPAGVMVGATLKQRGCPFRRHGVWFSRRYMTFLRLQDEAAAAAFDAAAERECYLLSLHSDVFPGVAAAFEALADECQSERMNAELSCKAILAALCVRLNRLVNSGGDGVLKQGDGNRLSPVLTAIHKECTTPLSVEDLAKRFSYSPSHLAHSFKKQMGTSLYHYVLLRRLQIGREAMLRGVPVKEAYQKCGFGDYAGFYRAFIKEFGISPQQYKKRNS